MTITNQPSTKKAKAQKKPQTATRLPSARERRPALAALAVLLIAGGAVLAGWLALRQGQTSSYVVIVKDVSKGEQIEKSDLATIDLPTSDRYVSGDDLSTIADQYAQVDMLEDQALIPAMVGPEPELAEGSDLLGLALVPGQYPLGLEVGDEVVVNLLSSTGERTVPELRTSGVVRDIENSESGGGARVDVVLSSKCSDQYNSAASVGNVGVVARPAGSSVLDCETPSSSAGG